MGFSWIHWIIINSVTHGNSGNGRVKYSGAWFQGQNTILVVRTRAEGQNTRLIQVNVELPHNRIRSYRILPKTKNMLRSCVAVQNSLPRAHRSGTRIIFTEDS